MFRFLFNLILLLLLAALLYGFWLLYRGKSPEEQADLRRQVARTARDAGRTAIEAGRKVVEKGQQTFGEIREGEGE